jgi:hypothetical protein
VIKVVHGIVLAWVKAADGALVRPPLVGHRYTRRRGRAWPLLTTINSSAAEALLGEMCFPFLGQPAAASESIRDAVVQRKTVKGRFVLDLARSEPVDV